MSQVQESELIAGAKHPQSLSAKSIWKSVKRALAQVTDTDMSLSCAGASFFIFLSIFPAIAASIAIFGLLLDPSDILTWQSPLSSALPDAITETLGAQISAFVSRDNSMTIGLLISLVFATWSGTRGANALVHTVNKAYHESDKRSFFQNFKISILTTLGIIIILISSIISLAILPAILAFIPLPFRIEQVLSILRWPVVAIITGCGFFALYRMTTDRHAPKKRWVWPGATTATILWLMGSFGLSLYVENFANYEATFGSIAAAAILMLWLNFTVMVVAFGACLNSQLEWITSSDF